APRVPARAFRRAPSLPAPDKSAHPSGDFLAPVRIEASGIRIRAQTTAVNRRHARAHEGAPAKGEQVCDPLEAPAPAKSERAGEPLAASVRNESGARSRIGARVGGVHLVAHLEYGRPDCG